MKKNYPVTGQERDYPATMNILSTTNPKGVITYVNPDFCDVSGFNSEELIKKSHNMVRHPEMPPAAFEDLWQTIKAGQRWMGLVKNRCKNGAGEQGRGFVVVADEVRMLAQRSQAATQEIQGMIEQLQGRARQAVEVMDKSQAETEHSVKQTGEAGDALNAIDDSVHAINDMNSQIAKAVEEQASVIEEINHNMVNINDLANDNSTGMKQMEVSCQNLMETATNMESLVDQFWSRENH